MVFHGQIGFHCAEKERQPRKYLLYLVWHRVRTKDHEQLLYIGQTKRLRRRFNDLSVNACADRMPFNDPHTAAQSLWILRVEEKMAFEFSGAATELSDDKRRGLEHMLHWKYHSEKGESPFVSHGRFHARYFRSGSRESGKRGGLLPPGQINPASGPSSCPLELTGKPWERNWMGLSWSEPIELIKERLGSVPSCSGLYKILEASTNQLLYIGETKNLLARLKTRCQARWSNLKPLASFHVLAPNILDHQRRELETDLIGACTTKLLGSLLLSSMGKVSLLV